MKSKYKPKDTTGLGSYGRVMLMIESLNEHATDDELVDNIYTIGELYEDISSLRFKLFEVLEKRVEDEKQKK